MRTVPGACLVLLACAADSPISPSEQVMPAQPQPIALTYDSGPCLDETDVGESSPGSLESWHVSAESRARCIEIASRGFHDDTINYRLTYHPAGPGLNNRGAIVAVEHNFLTRQRVSSKIVSMEWEETTTMTIDVPTILREGMLAQLIVIYYIECAAQITTVTGCWYGSGSGRVHDEVYLAAANSAVDDQLGGASVKMWIVPPSMFDNRLPTATVQLSSTTPLSAGGMVQMSHDGNWTASAPCEERTYSALGIDPDGDEVALRWDWASIRTPSVVRTSPPEFTRFGNEFSIVVCGGHPNQVELTVGDGRSWGTTMIVPLSTVTLPNDLTVWLRGPSDLAIGSTASLHVELPLAQPRNGPYEYFWEWSDPVFEVVCCFGSEPDFAYTAHTGANQWVRVSVRNGRGGLVTAMRKLSPRLLAPPTGYQEAN